MVPLHHHQQRGPQKMNVYHRTTSAALQGTNLHIGLPDTGPKSGDQLECWARRADGHNIAVHLVGLLRDCKQHARSAPDLSMGDVVDENGVADAGHEGHPLLAIPRLSGVGQPLQSALAICMCKLSWQVPYSLRHTHSCLGESAYVITGLSFSCLPGERSTHKQVAADFTGAMGAEPALASHVGTGRLLSTP